MVVSAKVPASCAVWKFASYTSTVAARKLVASKKELDPLMAIASPLYTAPVPPAELSTASTAFVPEPFQPEMVPSSVSNKNRLGPAVPPAVTWKPCEELITVPVGVESAPTPCGGGMVTTKG